MGTYVRKGSGSYAQGRAELTGSSGKMTVYKSAYSAISAAPPSLPSLIGGSHDRAGRDVKKASCRPSRHAGI
jgi:hypothetical protein